MSTVNNYSLPPLAHEPGCTSSGCIDTHDTRISGQMKYNAGSLWGSIETAAAGEAHPIWFEIRPQTDVSGNINGAIQLQEDGFFFGGFVQNGSSFFTRGGDAFHGDGRWGDYTGTRLITL